jgi:hypothetical protein
MCNTNQSNLDKERNPHENPKNALQLKFETAYPAAHVCHEGKPERNDVLQNAVEVPQAPEAKKRRKRPRRPSERRYWQLFNGDDPLPEGFADGDMPAQK